MHQHGGWLRGQAVGTPANAPTGGLRQGAPMALHASELMAAGRGICAGSTVLVSAPKVTSPRAHLECGISTSSDSHLGSIGTQRSLRFLA